MATTTPTMANGNSASLVTEPPKGAPVPVQAELSRNLPTPQPAPSSANQATKLAQPHEGAAAADDSETQPAVPESVASLRPTAAGSKRTLMTHTKDGKLLSEKKLRRLEKNRLSARECRRRKREATEHLEREINVMEAENLRLRLQLQIGKEAEKSRMREQEKLTRDIDDLLKSGAPESEIHATLEEFKEKHADYGKSRRSAIEFHLRNIERLLMPTQTTSLVMHAIQGGDIDTGAPAASPILAGQPPAGLKSDQPVVAATPTNSAAPAVSGNTSPSVNFDPKALFHYLVNYLEVTPQQAAALKDSRRVSRELDSCLEQALKVLKELQQCLAQTGDDLEAEFNNIRNILTPTQAAKFLVWVANNAACMHMLNELWDRVYPAGTTSEGEPSP